jgi:GH25 family lysozyme M1 (1,4-beta-N-acetylmuramidase)
MITAGSSLYRKKQAPDRTEWAFWQHSEKGRGKRCCSAVDFNVFNGGSVQFTQLLVKIIV